jgi:tRNA threonylcarbamoyladenosine modification (KEOPS) complex  Pcc1 subunit
MTYELTISIPCNSVETAKLIVDSLSPESHQRMSKASLQIYSDDSIIFLTIKTDEVSTLRAAANSYMRWIETALAVHQLV